LLSAGSSTNPGPSAPPLVITVLASASLQPNIPPPEPGATPPNDAPPTTPTAANTHHLPLHCFLDFSELPSTTSSSPPTSSSRFRTSILLDDRLTAPFYRCSNLQSTRGPRSENPADTCSTPPGDKAPVLLQRHRITLAKRQIQASLAQIRTLRVHSYRHHGRVRARTNFRHNVRDHFQVHIDQNACCKFCDYCYLQQLTRIIADTRTCSPLAWEHSDSFAPPAINSPTKMLPSRRS
jgi:hypothetical protein